MADEPLAALAAIRERERRATPGPWGWRGNLDYGDPYLTSLGHRDTIRPDGTVVKHHAGDVLGHIPVELTSEDAILRGVGSPDSLPEPNVPREPADTYDKRYDAAIETVHACPPGGSRATPCCDRPPFELPPFVQMTEDPALVTCNEREPGNAADPPL